MELATAAADAEGKGAIGAVTDAGRNGKGSGRRCAPGIKGNALVNCRQGSCREAREARFPDSRRTLVVWGPETRKVRQLVGITKKRSQQGSFMTARQSDNLADELPPLPVRWTMKRHQFNEPFGGSRLPFDSSVQMHDHRARQQHAKRVWSCLCSFHKIASPADVEQVVIFELALRKVRNRLEMIEVKSSDDIAPPFSFQAVNAPEYELVSQPRPKALKIVVTLRTMPPAMTLFGIAKGFHASRRCAFVSPAAAGPQESTSGGRCGAERLAPDGWQRLIRAAPIPESRPASVCRRTSC